MAFFINTKLKEFEGQIKKVCVCVCVQRLPGEADIAHTVSHVAVTGEALLDTPLRFLIAALDPGQQKAPTH